MTPTSPAHDADTLAFYEREASVYAIRREAKRHRRLSAFMNQLAPGASILELGCGGGQDAEVMLSAGFAVTPTDGSPALAAIAETRLGRPVRVMRFDELVDEACFDAVWANASLLHAPAAALPGLFARIHHALKPAGLFCASFKAGDGGERDRLGRYYNFPSRDVLTAAFQESGPWRDLSISEEPGGGYDGVDRVWLTCLARKG